MPRRINKEECVNCGACEAQCPVDAISEVDNHRSIDEATCVDCGACEAVCPVSCIKAV